MATTKRKTIFIVIGRGLIMRNILRSGVLDHLKQHCCRIVIFIYNVEGKKVPVYLSQEFEDEQVHIEAVRNPIFGAFHKKFLIFTSKFVYNIENRKIRQILSEKGKIHFFFERFLHVPLSKISFLKNSARFLEMSLFSKNFYGKYFDMYKPDVVFSTSIISSFDLEFMKEAKRRGVKTVSMARGWDNVTTHLYKMIPDQFIVQNERMKRDAVHIQKISPDRITVTGFPQFDWYRKENILMTRKAFFNKVGLDPERKLIVWGASWTSGENAPSNMLIEAIHRDAFAYPVSLLIRSHYSDATNKRFEGLRNLKNVTIDSGFRPSDFFWEGSDPSIDETIHLFNTLYYADVVVTLCSTLTLDALCLDKPIINIGFKSFFDKDGNDVTSQLYALDYYKPIIDLGAVDFVVSEKELIQSVNNYLVHPEYRHDGRVLALDALCYKVDGQASKRVAKVILSRSG